MAKNSCQILLRAERRNQLCTWFGLTLWLWATSSQAYAFAPQHSMASYGRIFHKSSSSLQFSAAEIAHLRCVNGHQHVSDEEEDFYVHGIVPKTKSITGSMSFFAKFVVRRMLENRQLRLKRKNGMVPPKQGFRDNLNVLNEQRRNLVRLAGYNAPIIVPSFTFLLLGALTTSVIPQFYSECIQCVATLDPSRSKCMRALAGLAITSTLGALFTGMRGSLFWVAGESMLTCDYLNQRRLQVYIVALTHYHPSQVLVLITMSVSSFTATFYSKKLPSLIATKLDTCYPA